MCATTFVLGGAIGVAAKLNWPCMYVYADKWGFTVADHSKFSVMLACGIKWSHSERGNF